jgi:hypothetical protein
MAHKLLKEQSVYRKYKVLLPQMNTPLKVA